MKIDLSNVIKSNQVIAVAVSGGSDSMALLHYMKANERLLKIKVVALNVEHGIRGESSLSDTEFVLSYCKEKNIDVLSYKVDSLKKAREEKLSVEQAARVLRYDCFFDAIKKGKCDKVATAHHLRDNVETVLLNLFRGTGLKGVAGINGNYSERIIRPFLSVKKEEITDYIQKNSIPFITDETNFCDDYSRNFIRLNVLPKIKEIFPEAEKNISKFSEIAKMEDDFLDSLAKKELFLTPDTAKINIPLEKPLFNRAVIMALKHLGIEKDWEKVHIDSVFSLINSENGAVITLPKGLKAYREYDKIVFYKQPKPQESFPFALGKFKFCNKEFSAEKCDLPNSLKSGLFADSDKIPEGAVIRPKKEGDVFTKFGGGTKSLGDFFTDKKIPVRIRNEIPLLAHGNVILAIFGVAVSDRIKVDESTKTVIELK